MNRVPSLWLGLGLALAPAVLLAQAAGEASGADAPGELPPGMAASAAEQRSPLWMAVDAVHRQRDADLPGPADRRLTAEQRLQLREQIRRASLRQGAEQTTSARLDERR